MKLSVKQASEKYFRQLKEAAEGEYRKKIAEEQHKLFVLGWCYERKIEPSMVHVYYKQYEQVDYVTLWPSRSTRLSDAELAATVKALEGAPFDWRLDSVGTIHRVTAKEPK